MFVQKNMLVHCVHDVMNEFMNCTAACIYFRRNLCARERIILIWEAVELFWAGFMIIALVLSKYSGDDRDPYVIVRLTFI